MVQQFCYDYPRPAVTTDCIVFGYEAGELKVLLIKRGNEPFKGNWAFPGGFLNEDETADECVRRELWEETSLKIENVEQFFTFSDVKRDPRTRVVTIAYLAMTNLAEQKPVAGDDACNAVWVGLSDLPPLAFDHDRMLRIALLRLKEKLHFQPIGLELLPDKFKMSDLRRIYETLLETNIDSEAFEDKMIEQGLTMLEKVRTTEYFTARYFSFDREKYHYYLKKGLYLKF